MAVRLVHHPVPSLANSVSPFDDVITQMVRDEDVLIVCPYLNLSYLHRIFKLGKSVRLLTDAEEWLASSSNEARQDIRSFLEDFGGCVHHINSLHAKVIIASNKALVGSANLTHRGITKRIEMSVLFEQEPEVEELKAWFEELWARSSTVITFELDEYLKSLPASIPAEQENIQSRLTSEMPPIRSKLVRLNSPEFDLLAFGEESVNAHELLVERIRLFPSRVWADSYFGLMKEVIEAAALDKNDPRLVTSIPKSPGSWLLPVTINQRYVLAPYRKNKEFFVGVIFGAMFKTVAELNFRTAFYGSFDPLRGESDLNTPYFLRFNAVSIASIPEDFRVGWIRAVLAELERASSSSFRKFHQPLVYEAAINAQYREKLLTEAFSAA